MTIIIKSYYLEGIMQIKRLLFLLLMIGICMQLFYLSQSSVFAYWKDETDTDPENTEIILNEDEIEALKLSKELQKVAKIKAEDLLESNYFSHTSKLYGSTFNIMKDEGITYSIAGENLAGNINSQKAVEAWISSTTHRENIVEEKYNYTAICVIESPEYGKIFVQLFIGV
jgi:hypothetical protein